MVMPCGFNLDPGITTASTPTAMRSNLLKSSSMSVLLNQANMQTMPSFTMQDESHSSGSIGTLHWLHKHHLMPISSCWLKSQSKTRPSQPTLTVLRHITPSAAATLNPSTSICTLTQVFTFLWQHRVQTESFKPRLHCWWSSFV